MQNNLLHDFLIMLISPARRRYFCCYLLYWIQGRNSSGRLAFTAGFVWEHGKDRLHQVLPHLHRLFVWVLKSSGLKLLRNIFYIITYHFRYGGQCLQHETNTNSGNIIIKYCLGSGHEIIVSVECCDILYCYFDTVDGHAPKYNSINDELRYCMFAVCIFVMGVYILDMYNFKWTILIMNKL